MEQQPRRRGRPRSFEEQAVIAAAQALFWRRGFDAVTLDDVTAATGLHKPSLYAAFGDKLALYLATLDHYLVQSAERRRAAFASPALRDALSAWFAAELDVFAGDGPRGCMVFASALTVAEERRGVGLRGRRAIKALDGDVRLRLDQARAVGELAAGDVAALTDVVAATWLAIAVRSRAGELRPALEDRVARLLATVVA